MKRAGAKGEGEFTRISWDEALTPSPRNLLATKEEVRPVYHRRVAAWIGFPTVMALVWRPGRRWGSHSSQGTNETMKWVLGISRPRRAV